MGVAISTKRKFQALGFLRCRNISSTIFEMLVISLGFLLDFCCISLGFLRCRNISSAIVEMLVRKFPSDVKIFVEASFYAAQWTNKNSTVNIQEGQTTQRECYFKTFELFQKSEN